MNESQNSFIRVSKLIRDYFWPVNVLMMIVGIFGGVITPGVFMILGAVLLFVLLTIISMHVYKASLTEASLTSVFPVIFLAIGGLMGLIIKYYPSP